MHEALGQPSGWCKRPGTELSSQLPTVAVQSQGLPSLVLGLLPLPRNPPVPALPRLSPLPPSRTWLLPSSLGQGEHSARQGPEMGRKAGKR